MFVVLLNYVRSLSEIDVLISAHVKCLDKQLATGLARPSGSQEPRTGSIILENKQSETRMNQTITEVRFNRRKLDNRVDFQQGGSGVRLLQCVIYYTKAITQIKIVQLF